MVKSQALLLSASADTSAPGASGQFSREDILPALHCQPFLLPEKTDVQAIWVEQQLAQEIQDLCYKVWPGKVVTKMTDAHQVATAEYYHGVLESH